MEFTVHGRGDGLRDHHDRGLSTRRIVIVAAVAIAGVLLFVVPSLAHTSQSLPGTTIDGVDVGGRGRDDARAVIEQVLQDRQRQPVTVSIGDRSFDYVPGATLTADVDRAVDQVMSAGRSNVLAASLNSLAATLGVDRSTTLPVTADPDHVHDWLEDVADRVNDPVQPGGIAVDPDTLEVTTTLPTDSAVLDVDAAVDQVVTQVGLPTPDIVELSLTVAQAPTSTAQVEDLAARAIDAVAATFDLNANGATVTLSPAQIAEMLRSDLEGDELRLTVDEASLMEVVGDDRELLEVAPVDATFEPISDIPTFDTQGDTTWQPQAAELRRVPSQSGLQIDVARLVDDLGAALDDGLHALGVPMTTWEADLTTSEADALGVTQLLGTFTTYHKCCANRVTNIQRMADLVRGTVLRPGEEFSINEHVGKRTIENGFVADGAIFNGEIRQEVGGGVSQFATTTYNAAFFAGIDIVEHRAHSLYISRYPRGREATLNFPSIDLRLRNDTDHGLYIHTSYTGTSITVSLFGDNGGREVTAIMGSPYNYRAFETRRRGDPTLPAGTESVKQSGTQGYQVTVNRIIREDGEERTEDIVTTYHPKPTIILVGEGPAQPPTPSPTPAPSPEPTPDPSPEPTPTTTP